MLPGLKAISRNLLLRDILKTTVWHTLGKTVGFMVPFFIAAWFGASSRMDAFFLAYGLILFISSVFSSTVSTVIVPFIAELRSKQEDPGRLLGSVITLTGLLVLALSLILWLVAGPVMSLITPLDKEQVSFFSLVILELVPLILLLTYSSILDGALNAYKKFTLPALSLAFRALVNISLIFILKNRWGVHAIIIGYLCGEILRTLILLLAVKRHRLFTLRFTLSYNKALAAFFKKAFFQISGMILVSLNGFIDKTMAAWISEGSVSVLYYAERLYLIPVSLIITGLSITLLTHWSEQFYEKAAKKFFDDIRKTVKITSAVTLPLALILILLSRPLVGLIFSSGNWDLKLISKSSLVFSGYLIGFTPYVLCQVYVRGHLVLKNTKILLVCGLIMAFSNILLNLLLMQPFQETGLAFSTSLVNIICLIFLLLFFNRQHKKFLSQSLTEHR